MNNNEEGKKNDTIKYIIHNNNYETTILNKVSKKSEKEEKSRTRWVKFTYVGKNEIDHKITPISKSLSKPKTL